MTTRSSLDILKDFIWIAAKYDTLFQSTPRTFESKFTTYLNTLSKYTKHISLVKYPMMIHKKIRFQNSFLKIAKSTFNQKNIHKPKPIAILHVDRLHSTAILISFDNSLLDHVTAVSYTHLTLPTTPYV